MVLRLARFQVQDLLRSIIKDHEGSVTTQVFFVFLFLADDAFSFEKMKNE